MENSIGPLHDFLQQQAGENRLKIVAARAALKEIDEQHPLSKDAEWLCEIVNRHQNAVRKLSGITGAVKDADEQNTWVVELLYCRKELNDHATRG